MGGGVADDFQTLRVFGSDDGQITIHIDHIAGVHHLTRCSRCALLVHFACQCSFGQAGANRGGNLCHRDRCRIFALGAIGERDVDHGCLNSINAKARTKPRH